jgi:uncharacterized protein YbjT (DUF2867 family)
VGGDIADRSSLDASLEGADAAYYLVHSLDSTDFANRDRVGAHAFARAAVHAGVRQVIYLGGLGRDDDQLSEHLRSRREVERILRDGAPTTALRAAIVVGQGSISWEVLCQLVERLPAMVTPRWVDRRCQPIALPDAVDFLVGALGRDDTVDDTFEIGCPEVMTYRGMLETVARLTSRRRLILPVPVLSPRLSSHWLRVITDVDLTTARSLVDSLTNDVIVTDRRLEEMLQISPMGFRDAAEGALHDRMLATEVPAPASGL